MEFSLRWLVVIAGLYGLVIGSAINAVVWRLYVGRSWSRGRSECPDCHHVLAPRDLIPVLSWLSLGGKCRYCRKRIHWQYPVVEALTAGLFALSAWRLAPVGVWGYGFFFAWLILLVGFIILAVYDARWMILPDKVLLPLTGLCFIYAVASAAYGTVSSRSDLIALAAIASVGAVAVVGLIAWSRWETRWKYADAVAITTYAVILAVLSVAYQQSLALALTGPLLAAVGASLAFYMLAVATKGKGMGGGDIKLVFALGLLLGIAATLLALQIAFTVGAIFGIVLLVRHKRKLGMQLPFGPFLIAGLVTSFLYGRTIIDWYLAANGLR